MFIIQIILLKLPFQSYVVLHKIPLIAYQQYVNKGEHSKFLLKLRNNVRLLTKKQTKIRHAIMPGVSHYNNNIS